MKLGQTFAGAVSMSLVVPMWAVAQTLGPFPNGSPVPLPAHVPTIYGENSPLPDDQPRAAGIRSVHSEKISIATERNHRINGEIHAPEVRLLGKENEQLGVFRLGEARRMAEEADVDLVEIAPNATPPVCRLMDYGKFRYQEQKRAAEAKARQKVVQIKEVKFRPQTDDGDYNIKLRNMISFLQDGDKVKITLRFRGREMAHQEFGIRLLERVRNDIEEIAQVESMPRLEGRQMVMMVAPKKKK